MLNKITASDNNRAEKYKVDLNLVNKNDVRVIASEFIEPNSRVLDIGCACGDFGAFLSQQKNSNLYGMEYDSASIAIAARSGAYKQLHQVDLNNFNEEDYSSYYDYFDTIAILDVLEHVQNPERVLNFAIRMLSNEGRIVLSLPNVAFCDVKIGLMNNEFKYTDTGILDKTHIKFYTHKSIAELVSSLELEIISCRPKVGYFSEQNLSIPNNIRRYIKQDPSSFVYQYVLNLKPSTMDTSVLKKSNQKAMDLKMCDLEPELKTLKSQYLKHKFFPKGSRRHKLALSVKQILTKRS